MNVAENHVSEFLELLRKKNVYLRLVNENIRIEAAKADLNPLLIKEIKKRKPEIIAFFQNLALDNQAQEQITKATEQEGYPLSSNQLGLWLSTEMHKDSLAYNMHGKLKLNRTFQKDLFEQALTQTIERHEILRTVFKQDEAGNVKQWIQPAAGFIPPLSVIDLSNDQEVEEKIEAYIAADTQRLFDLANGPLLRVVIFDLGPEQCVLYYNMHHIISDAWSMNVLVKDLLAFYEASENGTPADLQPLDIQYKDYASWQQEQVYNGAMDLHKKYWVDQFGGELSVLDLFPNNTRPKNKTTNGNVLASFINKQTAKKFEQLCKDKGGSLFMGLLTALNILFRRYTNQKDIVLGVPVSGRDHSNLNDQIGFYINTLALRNKQEDQETFDSLFKKVTENTLQAFKHGSFPFNDLVKSLPAATRYSSRSPLFDIFVNLQNVEESIISEIEDVDELNRQSESNEILDLGGATCKFDMVFNFQEINNAIYLALEYNSDIYTKDQISSLITHLKNLMSAIVEAPEAMIGKLNILSNAEFKRVVHDLNGSATSFSETCRLIRLLEVWAYTNKDEAAILFKHLQLTFGELNEHVNQLANFLLKNGITQGSLVPIYMDRSPNLLISILGVLKSGAAFVPLDRHYPRERLQLIVDEVNPSYIIADVPDLPFNVNVPTLTFKQNDLLPEEFNDSPTDNPEYAIEDKQLAYVLYTSGSTGTPKGVAIEHGSLNNYLSWVNAAYFDDDEVGTMGFFTSPSFDLSITSMFGSLVKGKATRIYPSSMDEVEIFTDYLRVESPLDVIKLTPAHIDLIAAADLGQSNIKKAIVGGDILLPRHVSTLKKLNNAIQIYNEYGPTEATVGCSVWEVDNNSGSNISIGKPIINTRMYILNDALQPLPAGQVGELYISGVQVARGYLNREDLTRDKFLDDPFMPGNRMYKTGDLGKWLPDGNIDFVGRKDFQIKLRGYRIELSEIEKVADQFPTLQEACVVAKRDEKEDYQIILFYTAQQDFEKEALTAFFRDRLPEYMIPSIFQKLKSFPLTSNGKVDRKKLGELDTAKPKVAYVAPRNETEAQLVEIWQEVLGLEQVGVLDNFFELGGHSIKAIKILSMVYKKFGVTLGIQEMFENPTLEFLSELIEDALWVSNQANTEQVVEGEVEKFKF